ncbi:Retrovirus-related Pol polyprotein from transposon TNT 1-94 [Vitis vinifera]|uniref:Retrovirus-related Pol polyprotein from transposon TNT 1-94 n=1 Tax=Vitis vinifera TaxID=29760 RepID=A0A438JBG8_VITVI|nr:Retrovirus-related Pol polyprotein from transposon TNT 1-94 [Vitis vinifera]
MDVSFFEHVFFYPKSHVQGESMNGHQVWESLLKAVPFTHLESPNPFQSAPPELSTPMPSSVQPAQPTNVPSPVTIQFPMPIQPIAPQLANENLQVYIKRRKRQELEHGSQPTCGQYIDSISSLPEENIGEDRAGEVLIPSIDDSTLPIALRKGVPNTIQDAFKISEWKKAVQDEIDALEKNGTWTITDLPVGKRPVGCKWIFTIKYKADGLVKRFKARLVAKGFTQSYGIDYQETFAPVAKLNTIRILLSLAVNQDWCLQQLDIKNAFLNGDLEEEVYMEIPPGFEGKEFEVKDLGNLKYFLGMEVARSRKGIVVSQRKYILDLLKETGMLGCKPINTPMDSQKKLGIEKESTPGKVYSSERQRIVTLKYTQMRIRQETSLIGGPLLDTVLLSGEILLPGGATISIAKNPVHHDRTKHVEIDRHFIIEKVTSETVKLNYVPTKHQTADILTKALPTPNFEDLTCKLGLYDIYSPA